MRAARADPLRQLEWLRARAPERTPADGSIRREPMDRSGHFDFDLFVTGVLERHVHVDDGELLRDARGGHEHAVASNPYRVGFREPNVAIKAAPRVPARGGFGV